MNFCTIYILYFILFDIICPPTFFLSPENGVERRRKYICFVVWRECMWEFSLRLETFIYAGGIWGGGRRRGCRRDGTYFSTPNARLYDISIASREPWRHRRRLNAIRSTSTTAYPGGTRTVASAHRVRRRVSVENNERLRGSLRSILPALFVPPRVIRSVEHDVSTLLIRRKSLKSLISQLAPRYRKDEREISGRRKSRLTRVIRPLWNYVSSLELCDV